MDKNIKHSESFADRLELLLNKKESQAQTESSALQDFQKDLASENSELKAKLEALEEEKRFQEQKERELSQFSKLEKMNKTGKSLQELFQGKKLNGFEEMAMIVSDSNLQALQEKIDLQNAQLDSIESNSLKSGDSKISELNISQKKSDSIELALKTAFQNKAEAMSGAAKSSNRNQAQNFNEQLEKFLNSRGVK